MTDFSLGHVLPMEIVNKILISRPTHPVTKLFRDNSRWIYSLLDTEKKLFLVINNSFSICIYGNEYLNYEFDPRYHGPLIKDGQICLLDEDAKCNLPYSSSGIEEVQLVAESYDKIYYYYY